MIKNRYVISVKSIKDITPNLRRITFFSDELVNYPSPSNGRHIKIFIPYNDQTVVRTYSIRNLRVKECEIDIEFVLHGTNCPASGFAIQAKLGDTLTISNPGGPDPVIPKALYHYFVGDLSALPPIAAILEGMPKDSLGQVMLLIDSQQDCIKLDKPDGVYINNFKQPSELIDFFKELILPEDNVHFWIAGEEKMVVALRNYIRKERNYDRQHISAVPYWRDGVNEELYHHARHIIMDSD